MMSCVGTCTVSDFILSASALSSPCLDLSRKGIRELPSELPGCSKLECLYLEGNHLTSLPESLFTSCPNLRWLDLRNNKLKALSPSFEKLRLLRTLLLEGNQLTALPPQLGLNRKLHLSGLNLSCNPLRCPPKYVTEKGTKAILKYLRELLNETGAENNSCDSTEHSPEAVIQQTPSPLYPVHPGCSISTAQPSVQQLKTYAHPPLGLPTLLMQRARLHALQAPFPLKLQPPQHSPAPERPQLHRKKQYRHGNRKKGRGQMTPAAVGSQSQAREPPHWAHEKEEISAIIERQKSQRCLEEWQDEARERQQRLRMQVNQCPSHPRASEAAPFATELGSLARDGQSEAGLRLQSMDGQHSAMTQLHNAQGSATSSTNSLRDVREQEVSKRIRRYTLELQEQRKQVGLIHSPSSELLEAERRLAEAVVRRREVEARKAREYRLTAFTGDLPFTAGVKEYCHQ